ncbi:hypothetical protein ACWDRB_62720 [Nonomuraea sp. NPDC003707]
MRDRVEDVLARRGEMSVLLRIRPIPEVLVNAHFFTDAEIEVDFEPLELQGQERLDVVCAFLRAVGRCWASRWSSPEGNAEHPLIGYDLATDRVVAWSTA